MKEATWVVARDMVNAKKLGSFLKKLRLEVSIKKSVSIDEDINYL